MKIPKNPKGIYIRGMRFIQWHELNDSYVLPIDGSTFITGENKSGKSTIFDGMRLLFFLQTRWFGKGKTKEEFSRTVESFVRCSYDEEGNNMPCKRPGKATSYIVAELYDYTSNSPIVIGVCMNMEPGDERATTRWWYAKGHKMSDYELMPVGTDGRKHIYPIWDLENRPGYEGIVICKTKSETKKNWSLLFGLTDNYLGDEKAFDAWVKTEVACISVKGKEEIGDVSGLIKNFILKPSEEDTRRLQEGLEAFKEQYAQFADARDQLIQKQKEAAALDKVRDTAATYREKVEEGEKLRIAANIARQESLTSDIEKADTDWAAAKKEVEHFEEEIQKKNDEWSTYTETITEYRNSSETQALNNLYQRRDALKKSLSDTERAEDELRKETAGFIAPLVDSIHNLFGTPMVNEDFIRAMEDKALPLDSSHVDCLMKLKGQLSSAAEKTAEELQVLDEQRRKVKEEWEEVQKTVDRLQSGITSVDAAGEMSAVVKDYISQKFQEEGIQDTPTMLCDLLEYKDDSWANAVEAHMGAYRYSILVLPPNYKTAAKAYKELSQKNKKIFGVTLVDTGALELGADVKENTLPDVFKVENPYAAAYMQFAYGNVQLVDDATEISRKQGTFLSKDGMRYSRFSLQKLRPVQHIVIGAQAKKKMLAEFIKQRDRLNTEVTDTSRAANAARAVRDKLVSDRYNDFRHKSDALLEKALGKDALKHQLDDISREIIKANANNILQNITSLEDKRKVCEKERAALERKKQEAMMRQKEAANEQTNKQEELNRVEEEIENLQKENATMYHKAESFWNTLRGKTRKGPRTILQDFIDQQQALKIEQAEINQKLKGMQEAFCKISSVEYDCNGMSSMALYEESAKMYSVDSMAMLQVQCEQNERLAYDYFKRSAISMPKNEYNNAVKALKRLNAILKKMPFQNITYSFDMPSAAPGYEDYFEMLFSDDNVEQSDQVSLMSEAFDDKYGAARKKLFDELMKTDDLAKCQLLDYLTYCKFDMHYTYVDDETIRGSLSTKGANSSTSEADIPCYIILAAALVQKWNRDNRATSDIANPHALKLMMVDEAFFSMDVVRTDAIVSFIQDSLGIQLFCAAPSDKFGSIGYLMDGVIRMSCNNRKHVRASEYLPISLYSELYDEDGERREQPASQQPDSQPEGVSS